MRRSKIEMYIDVLTILFQRGPLIITHIMYKSNINCRTLKECLEYLIKQGLIEEITIGKNRMVYAITQQGKPVVKNFREVTQALPILKVNSEVYWETVIC